MLTLALLFMVVLLVGFIIGSWVGFTGGYEEAQRELNMRIPDKEDD